MQKRRIKCDYDDCSRSYCSYFNLKRHIESSHLGVKKFKCQICSRHLSSKQNYIDHQNFHTGAKPYLCEHTGCLMRFRQLSQFYLHTQLHSEIVVQLNNFQQVRSEVLNILVGQLSKETPKNYTIPLLPYSVDSIHLPKIVQSDQSQITLPLPLELTS